MENYLFYEPLQQLKAIVEAGEIGDVAGYHLKMVASGRGGWDVPDEQLRVAVPADARRAAGSSCSTTAGTSSRPRSGCSARSARCARGSASTEVVPGIAIDAPTTIAVGARERRPRRVGHHARAPTCTCAPTTTRTTSAGRSPGRSGYARVNRCTGRGIQQPSLEVYADGEMRAHHALDDDWASSFRDSGRHWLRWLHTGDGPLWWSGEEAVDVLRFALAAYASSEAGGIGVDPATPHLTGPGRRRVSRGRPGVLRCRPAARASRRSRSAAPSARRPPA